MTAIESDIILAVIGFAVLILLAFAGWVVTTARSIASSVDKLTMVLNRLGERLAITETNVSHIARDVERLERREALHDSERGPRGNSD